MLDLNLIRKDPDYVKAGLAKRGYEADFTELLKWDEERRAILAENESIKAERNKLNKQMPALRKQGQDVAPLLEQLKGIAGMFQGSFTVVGEYPAWEYRKDSTLRDTMVEVYTRMFEKEPQVLAIHAGLECGLFSQKVEGLDCVSIGPQMQDIHTSREKLDIASVERTWRFLLEVLKAL